MEKYNFSRHNEYPEDFLDEYRYIMAKPEGERIDADTMEFIRARFAGRLEEMWTDPKEVIVPDNTTQIVENVRAGKKIEDSTEISQVLSKLLQDYRLSPDERDAVKSEIFGE